MHNTKDVSKKANKRGMARFFACNAIYQMDLSGSGALQIIEEYESGSALNPNDEELYLPMDVQWFRMLVNGVVSHQIEIDPLLNTYLPEGWSLSRIDVLLRAILRCGIFELQYCTDVPKLVVINEYIDITKAYFGAEEINLTNGILHCISLKLRPDIS